MSLKYFHIGFIVICLIFAWGLAAWCLLVPGQAPILNLMGWISLVGGFALLIYGIQFYKKIKNIEV